MPTSSNEGKEIIRQWVSSFAANVNTVLDLGVGQGTYHKMFTKRKFGNLLSHANWIGVEAWNPYIEEFELNKRYNKIINDDIRKVDFSALGDIDLVFAGDVLEHMTKEESILVVNRLLVNCKRIIISIPIVHFPQEQINDNPFEEHVKDDWSNQEVLESFSNITATWLGQTIGVYLLERK